MSDNFSSYFLLGFGLVIAFVLLFVFINWKLFIASLLLLWEKKIKTLISIFIAAIPFLIISGALLINSSIANSFSEYRESKIGEADLFMYSFDENKYLSVEETNEILATVGDLSVANLNIQYRRIVQNDSLPFILLSFDETPAREFDRDFDINLSSLQTNEAILSQSLASVLELQEGESVKIQDQTIIIKRIVSDNGLIGFNAPVSTSYFVANGAMYVTESTMSTLFPLSSNKYNGILIRTKANEPSLTKLNEIKRKLAGAYESLTVSDLNRDINSLGNFANGFNIGQTILVIGVVPLITSIVLFLAFYEYIKRFSSPLLASFALLNKRSYRLLFNLFQGIISITIGGLLGTLSSYLLIPVVLGVLKQVAAVGIERVDYSLILNTKISAESISFAYTGSWIILVLTVLLWSLRKSKEEVTTVLKNVPYLNHQVWNTKKLLTVFAYLVGVCGIWFVVGRIWADSPYVSNLAPFLAMYVMAWILAYALQFSYRPYVVIPIASIFTIGLTIWIFHLSAVKNFRENDPYVNILVITCFIFSGIWLIIYSIPYCVSILVNNFDVPKGLRQLLLLSSGVLQKNKSFTFLSLIIGAFLISILSMGGAVDTISKKTTLDFTNEGYDVTIFDESGRSTIQSTFVTTDSQVTLAFDTVYLPDFINKTTPGYVQDIHTFLDSDEQYSTPVSVLPDRIMLQQKLVSSIDSMNSFLNTGQFILLGKNYSLPATPLNIRPQVKPGDIIQIKLSENNVIKRKVLGYVGEIDRNQKFDPSLFLDSGIIFSNKDYETLKMNGVYFSSVKAFDLPDTVPYNDVEEKLFTELKTQSISDIKLRQRELTRSREILTYFFNAVSIVILFSLICLMLMYLTIVNLIQHSWSEQFKLISFGGYLLVIILAGFLAGLVFWITDFYYNTSYIPIKVVVLITVLISILAALYLPVTFILKTISRQYVSKK